MEKLTQFKRNSRVVFQKTNEVNSEVVDNNKPGRARGKAVFLLPLR